MLLDGAARSLRAQAPAVEVDVGAGGVEQLDPLVGVLLASRVAHVLRDHDLTGLDLDVVARAGARVAVAAEVGAVGAGGVVLALRGACVVDAHAHGVVGDGDVGVGGVAGGLWRRATLDAVAAALVAGAVLTARGAVDLGALVVAHAVAGVGDAHADLGVGVEVVGVLALGGGRLGAGDACAGVGRGAARVGGGVAAVVADHADLGVGALLVVARARDAGPQVASGDEVVALARRGRASGRCAAFGVQDARVVAGGLAAAVIGARLVVSAVGVERAVLGAAARGGAVGPLGAVAVDGAVARVTRWRRGPAACERDERGGGEDSGERVRLHCGGLWGALAFRPGGQCARASGMFARNSSLRCIPLA